MKFYCQDSQVTALQALESFITWGLSKPQQNNVELESVCFWDITGDSLERVFNIGLRSDNVCRELIKQSGVILVC